MRLHNQVRPQAPTTRCRYRRLTQTSRPYFISAAGTCFGPCRDQVLRLSGFGVDSTTSVDEGLSLYWAKAYDLVLIDVEGENKIPDAEKMCSEIKTTDHTQRVAFVCNWRVAIMTDCPDEILRTEFDPQRFVSGVKSILHTA